MFVIINELVAKLVAKLVAEKLVAKLVATLVATHRISGHGEFVATLSGYPQRS